MRRHRILAIAMAFTCGGLGCEDAEHARSKVDPPAPVRAAFEQGRAAPVPAMYVAERVQDAKARLLKSEAGKTVWSAIEAHGGLAAWYAQGTMEFSFNYQPEGQPERVMHTRQKVDLWRSHARHEEQGAGADATFAFDGKRAWIVPGPEAFPSTARFWALTPYYFVAMPFVLADPGVIVEALDDAELDGETFDLVKATYEAGVGDAPDDYYILYFNQQTHQLRALRYVVSYPGFFEKGKHSPEKLMHFDRFREKAPHLARQLDTYAWVETTEKPGELKTTIEAEYHAFGSTFDADWLEPPANAVITEQVPTKKAP